MHGLHIRFAVVLLGTGIGLAYLLSAAFLIAATLRMEEAFGLVPALLILLPALIVSVTAGSVLSIPLGLLGSLLVSLGIRNQAASPFIEVSSENVNA